MKSTKGCDGVLVKMFNDGSPLIDESFNITANTEFVYSKSEISTALTSTGGLLIFDFGYAPANTDIDIYDIAIFAEEPSVFTELFDIENATICKVEPSSDNPPEAVIDTENGTINIELKAYRGWQWGNQVHVCTGITTLNPNAEYKFYLDAKPSWEFFYKRVVLKEDVPEDENEASLIILNTCAVRENAEDRVFGIVGSMKKLWIVEPPAFNAAMPVGARTMHSSPHLLRNSRTTVDLPVPASPVRNTFLPDIIAETASSCSAERTIESSIIRTLS